MEKTLDWAGPNKAIVRDTKIGFVKKSLPKGQTFLTFPGASARFERSVVESNLSTPENIVGIQWEEKTDSYDGKVVLERLLERIRDDEYAFAIFAGSYNTFVRGYKSFLFGISDFLSGVADLDNLEFLDKLEGKELSRFLRLVSFWARFKNKPRKLIDSFSVVDDDTCGQFSIEHFSTMNKLFNEDTSVLARSGVLMINHQKGRERPGTVGFVNEFLTLGGTLFESVREPLFRYVLVPQMYVTLAWRNGIHLSLKHVIEYRDMKELDGPGCGGVTMLQYLFTFDRDNCYEEVSRDTLKEVLKSEKEKRYASTSYSKYID